MGCMPDAPHTVSKTTNKQTYVLKHNVGNTMQHMCVVDIHFFMCDYTNTLELDQIYSIKYTKMNKTCEK